MTPEWIRGGGGGGVGKEEGGEGMGEVGQKRVRFGAKLAKSTGIP